MEAGERAGAERLAVLDEANSRRALQQISSSLYPIVGATPRKEELEKWMCFVVTVWNTVVTMQVEQDHTVARPLFRTIDAMPEPQRTVYSDLLLELTSRKLREFPLAGWVYRHVHVYRDPGGHLRVRVEALTWGQWLALGSPLWAGLPQ